MNLKKNGETHIPSMGGTVYIPVPDGWSIDSKVLYKDVTKIRDGILTSITDYLPPVTINGKTYLRYQANPTEGNANVENASVAIGQIQEKTDPTKLADGLYVATVQLLKAGTAGETSMADLALNHTALLRVKDGKKSIRLNFSAIDMGEPLGLAYVGAIWNKSDKDVIYTNFETDETGKLLDNAGFNAQTEFPCVKQAMISLDEATWNAERSVYECKVIPPAMAAGKDFEYVYSNPIGTDLAFKKIEFYNEDPDYLPMPVYQKAVLRRSVDKAKMFTEADYTAESFAALKTALTAGEAYYNSLGAEDASNDHAISAEIKAKSDAIETAITNLVRNEPVTADKTALDALIVKAEAYKAEEYTEDSFAALTAAIAEAVTIGDKIDATQEEVDAAKTALQTAIDGLKSKDSEKVDVNKLPNGKYTLSAEMFKTDRKSFSMSNNAINHDVWLEVTEDGYFLTVQFKGLSIFNKFGYLSNLSYFDAGYTYENGIPTGKLVDAEVLEVMKDAEGKVIVDQYNTAETPYPSMLRFKLVDKAGADFVPLQVFVPIMEAIAEDNGTQQVLMKLDWTKIKADDETILPDAPEKEYPEVDAEDKNTGIKIHADKNVFTETVKLVVDPILKGENGFDAAAKLLLKKGSKFQIFEIHFENEAGEEVQPNGQVSVSYKIPAGYDAAKTAVYRVNGDGTLTKVSGAAADGYFTVTQKSFSVYALVDTTKTAPVEPSVPDTTDPEVPETTVPETTAPAVPETTVPETTAPAVPETTVPETTAPADPSAPQTGDSVNLMGLISLTLVSTVALAVLVLGKKRKSAN